MPEGVTVTGPFDISYAEASDPAWTFTTGADEIIEDARDYATNAITEINAATDRIADLALVDFNVTVPEQASTGIDFDMSQQALADVMGRAPTKPTIDDIPIDLPEGPTIDGNPVQFPDELAIDTIPIDLPEGPSIDGDIGAFPTAPVIEDIPIDLPAEPTVDLPTIPDVAEYAEAILEAVFDKLLDDLTNGTYGINENVELALWERARDREMNGLREVIEQSKEEFTASGFSMPPGALKKSMDKARKVVFDNLGNLNREIAFKRADMYVEARKFTIEQILKLQEVLLANVQAKIEAAKAVVAIYTSQVEAWKARIEVLKIEKGLEVDVFKAQVEGWKAGKDAQVAIFAAETEAWKARLEALKTDKTIELEVYKSQAEAWRTLKAAEADIYRADVEAWKSKVDAEKVAGTLEVEVFKGEVDAYRAEISGIIGAFELGQKAREDEYRVILNALSANSEVAKLTLSELVEQAKLRLQGEVSIADVYKNIAAAAIGASHVNVGLSQSSSLSKSFGRQHSSSVSANIGNSYGESKRLGDDYQKTDYHSYKEK
jgi:hypothetical protein